MYSQVTVYLRAYLTCAAVNIVACAAQLPVARVFLPMIATLENADSTGLRSKRLNIYRDRSERVVEFKKKKK